MHVRRKFALLIVALLLMIFVFGCDCSSGDGEKTFRQNDGRFSVHFLDVGQGDCIFINFSDGKTFMIDTANGKKENNEYIAEFLKAFGVDKIDYLVITHPDTDHVGGTENLVNSFSIGKVYIPHILNYENFISFKKIIDLLNEKQTPTEISTTYKSVVAHDYELAFLTPYPLDFPNVESGYKGLNTEFPSDADMNNASPIIYLQYKGVRFLFTGDAGSSQEKILLENQETMTVFFQNMGIQINLENIDFLKVAHHGSSESSTTDFLNKLKPKNAVVSVSGGNAYGHPSTAVLERLSMANPLHSLYRTDVLGTISVYVSTDGQTEVVTD